MVYWSGPYDGEPIIDCVPGCGAHALPLKPRHDDAGRLVVVHIAAHERYQWSPVRMRYEWDGTRWPGKVDA